MSYPTYAFSCGHPVPQERIFGPQTKAWASKRLCPVCWATKKRAELAKSASKNGGGAK